MTTIKCYHCKGTHTSVADVKTCAQPKTTAPALTLEAILGEDVNPTYKTAGQIADEKQAADDVWSANITAASPKIPAHRQAAMEKLKLQPVAETVPVAVVEKVILKGQDLELGMYQIENEIFKIVWNKSNTFKYAMKLVITQKQVWDDALNTWKWVPKGKFVYGPYLHSITSEHKMTEEMAKAFHDATKAKYGVDYGFCCVCGKLLTVKKSIDAGIGPVCAGNL